MLFVVVVVGIPPGAILVCQISGDASEHIFIFGKRGFLQPS